MEWEEFALGEDDAGRRLDRVAKRLLQHRTQGQAYSALRKGLVKLNGIKARPEQITREGDVLSIAAFLLQGEQANTPDAPTGGEHSQKGAEPCAAENHALREIQVIFQNRHILFVNKPKGIPVHGEGSLAQILLAQPQHFNSNSTDFESQSPSKSREKSISFRPGPLHRLDKGTTGIIAFSKSLAGARWFSEGIRAHAIGKAYLGIAQGKIEREEEWLEEIGGKKARTKVVPLAYGKLFGAESTLARYEISTGRKHQIRIHSEMHGHPLAGDFAHGGNARAEKKFGKGRENFFLHATEMTFPQNALGVPPILRASLPEEFRAAIAEGFCSPEQTQNLENILNYMIFSTKYIQNYST